ncbi:MAG: hypothetical protein IJT16_14625 [Lachnospiraceae bacterium]|nr:hypothetical protein [Lachnospiraceae bacterium]
MQNPFTIYFGKKPEQFVLRLSQTNEIINTFDSDSSSTQVYLITGVRGCGKTVMMTDISNKLSAKEDWIAVELNPERDMLYWLTLFVADQPDSQTQFQYVYFIKNGN